MPLDWVWVFFQSLFGILYGQRPPFLVEITESSVGVVVRNGGVLHQGFGVALNRGVVISCSEQFVPLFLQLFVGQIFSGHCAGLVRVVDYQRRVLQVSISCQKIPEIWHIGQKILKIFLRMDQLFNKPRRRKNLFHRSRKTQILFSIHWLLWNIFVFVRLEIPKSWNVFLNFLILLSYVLFKNEESCQNLPKFGKFEARGE